MIKPSVRIAVQRHLGEQQRYLAVELQKLETARTQMQASEAVIPTYRTAIAECEDFLNEQG